MQHPVSEGQSSVQRPMQTLPQVAAHLGISRRKAWELVNSGEIPSFRVGRCLRLDPQDVDAWVRKQKKGGR